jgi:hypothetical protein
LLEGVVPRLEHHTKELILGEEDASEVVHKSAKSDFEVTSSDLPNAGVNLEISVMHIARICFLVIGLRLPSF